MERGNPSKKSSAISLQQFISTVASLIDSEKFIGRRDIQFRIITEFGRCSKGGSAILNLKCVDAQTGLMGKTLLEFQCNKGDVLPANELVLSLLL